MTSKTVMSMAFAAGCALAVGAMPSAHAQTYPQQPYMGPTAPQPYMTQQQPMPAEPMPGQQASTTVETNGPQASRGDFGDWSARRNNIESAHYDRLLETNMAFRHARERRECGPISDPQLHQQCLASFQEYEPVMYGSSTAPWRHRHHYRGAGY